MSYSLHFDGVLDMPGSEAALMQKVVLELKAEPVCPPRPSAAKQPGNDSLLKRTEAGMWQRKNHVGVNGMLAQS